MKNQKFLAAVVAVSWLVVGCDAPKKDSKAATEEVKKAEIVATQKAVMSDIMQSITYNGNIEPYKTNNITPPMPLRIAENFIEVGDMVKSGDIIAEMDKNQLIQQEIQYNNLKTELTRLEELYKAGGVAKQQLDQMQVQYDVATKALNYLKENSTLLSPINGVITARNYDKGDMYGQKAVATVMQIDSVKVRVNVSEKYFTNITKGMNVEITTENYPDKVFNGKISLIFPLIDAATRSFTVEITIPNKDMLLRPGMYTNVAINLGELRVVTVPDKAIQKQIGSNERFVYVVVGDTAIRKAVTVGAINNQRAEILSGVTAGDNVITEGAGRLIDGDKVTTK